MTEKEVVENKQFYENMKEKYDQRYFEKQAGIKHGEEPSKEESEVS